MTEINPTVRGTRERLCPHCGNVIFVRFTTEFEFDVASPTPNNREPFDWRQGMTQAQVELVEQFKESGSFEAFVKVTEKATAAHMPRCMERFLLTVLKTAEQKSIPQAALQQLIKSFGGKIEVWAAQGVCMVIADGSIRAFVELTTLAGRGIRAAGGKLKARTRVEPEVVRDWIRTRFGFVSGRGELFDTLRKRSIGEFARPSLSAPNK